MEQSVSRVSGKGAAARIFLVLLLSLLGLTVVGAGEAYAVAAPVVKSLGTTTGTANGGTTVVINGSGFGTAPSVTFGGVAATVVSSSGVKITATSPAANSSTAVVDVLVTNTTNNPPLTSSPVPADQYTYTWAPPTITSVSPATGPTAGGTSVTITGTNLNGSSAVKFGATAAASFSNVSPTSVTATSPAGSSWVDVSVTNPNSTSVPSNGDVFTYLTTPTVSGVRATSSPAGGPTGGGTFVTIDGTGFTSDATVEFGSTPATGVLVNSLNSITATSPAGSGVVNVTVHTALGTSAVTGSDTFTYNSTLALVNGTGGYSAGDSTVTPIGATKTSQTGTSVTVTAPGTWTVGEVVYMTGFTNGLPTQNYTVAVAGSGSFQVTTSATTTGTGTGNIIPLEAGSFNPTTLVTGGGTIDPTTLTAVSQPAAGTLVVIGSSVVFTPAQSTPTSTTVLGTTTWTQHVTASGTQTGSIALCETGHSWTGPGSVGCATATLTYLPSATGFYMGNEIAVGPLTDAVVVDTGSAVSAPASASQGSTFTTVTAPAPSLLPAFNGGYQVNSVGGYQAVTPVAPGLSLVPGSLHVTGGDAATSGKYIVSYCTAAMGYVAGECTANFTGNFHATYPYIETSLNAGIDIAGGTQITLPTVTAQWTVTASSGSVSSYETEFNVVTNVAPPIGTQSLDAYPSDLASYNNQGLGQPTPNYAAPAPRWTVNVTPAGNAPTVTGVSPSSGPAAGGTPITLTGTNFTGATAVTVGGVAATSVTVVSATTITATTPAGAAGPADVSVTANGITGTDSGGFTYVAAPTVTTVSPSAGPATGGTVVTITGTNLTGATSVTFGGVAGTALDVSSGSSLTVTTPAGSAGTADVVVTTPGGATTDPGAFLYVSAPTVTAVAPATGSTAGGTQIVITGTHFAGTPTVTVGGTAATGVVVNSSTSITAVTPAGAPGAVAVAVTTAGGSASDPASFTYVAPATITSLSPATGKAVGGDTVTITGTNLTGTTAVTFGSSPATGLHVVSSTSVTAVTPAGTGTVAVGLTTPAGTVTDPSAFVYVAAPTITSVSPGAGPTAGGTQVTITGTNFTTVNAVTFGSTAATSYTLNSATSITAISPATATSTVSVSVSTVGGTATDPGAFQFTDAPTVSSVSPSAGPLAGGVTVTVDGSNLTGVDGVKFGTTTASFTPVSNTELTAVAPAGSAGTVDITVTKAPDTSPTSAADEFTYVALPTVTGVSPVHGPVAGGTQVTITGTNFVAPATVTFGSSAASNVVVVSSTTITATTAAGVAGPVNVSVTTPGGSATETAGYTYLAPATITSVAPDTGTTLGGTGVTITGTNFTGATAVTIGGTAATGVTIVSATSITAVTPSGAAGPADVSVTTLAGTVTDAGGFTYVSPPPTITSIAPDTGSALGGDSVTITGTNFTGATSVTIGGAAATGVTIVSATSITAVTPAGTAGPADVVVFVPGGSATAGGAFTYDAVAPAPPAVTGVTTGDGSATVQWAPGLDGGTPVLSYTATAIPVFPGQLAHLSGPSCTVAAPATSCTITGLTNGTAYTFTVTATNAQGSSDPSTPSAPATPSASGAIPGYWTATSAGGVLTNGAAVSYGSPAGLALSAPIVALVPTPDRHGYWMVGADGGVFAYGDATFYGSTGGTHLNQPIVGMAATSDGKGYWLVAADGGVFAYGDAAFAGSAGGTHLNSPVVGVAGNGTGGYWLVAADGGVFAYGSAAFAGSAGGTHLNSPIVGIAALAGGGGYYLAAADGGVFAYGSAAFAGSAAGVAAGPVVGITGGAAGGYTLVTSTGNVYAFGAGYYGNQGGTAVTAPIVGISS